MGDVRLIGAAVARRPEQQDAWLWDVEVRVVQPYQATKTYLCPGCSGTIPPGLGHVVVVPREAADLRRHWHRGCWSGEARRRGLDPFPSPTRP